VHLLEPQELQRQLNPPQWEAVTHTEGPLLILAGAGSGKTRVLAYRIAYLVGNAGVEPWSILSVTFTNKAAREMRRRVEALLGGRVAGAWIGTFHGICLRILRKHADLLAVGPRFAVYDNDDQKHLATAVVADLGLDPKRFKPPALLYRVHRAKDEGLGPDDLKLPARSSYADALPAFYAQYQKRLREARAVDFGDILLETLHLLRNHPDVAAQYQQRFTHLLIDEYQDTNRVQYWLARELAKANGNLCVVGDDDQSIYSWRGADLRNILSFEEDFPGTKIVKLEQNYRSTQAILDAAAAVVARNRSRHPKKLWTERQGGELPRVHEAATEENEAKWVAETIRELPSQGLRYSDVALLYRVHALSRPFEEAFLARGIPYVVYGGLRFYDRKEVKDALAYLRLVVNPDDPVAFRRAINTPARGIGRTTVEVIDNLARSRGQGLWEATQAAVEKGALATRSARAVASFVALLSGWQEAAGTTPLRELLARILEESGYVDALKGDGADQAEERLENLEELLNATEAFERDERGDVYDFLDRAALVTDQDLSGDRVDLVTLMTLHSAKGLEYPVVFLAGLEEGVFPHHMSSDTPEEIEEERRLCYVGITRAKDRLYLTRARKRRVYGREDAFRLPSRFLQELPPGFYRRGVTGGGVYTDPDVAEPPPPEPAESRRYLVPEPGEADYQPGMQVRHPRYGVGAVLRTEGRGPRAKVTVQFQGAGTRKFLAAMAGLEVALDD
jgi:DNA helicase-2/ATP-dependent DNA helicase PcrA